MFRRLLLASILSRFGRPAADTMLRPEGSRRFRTTGEVVGAAHRRLPPRKGQRLTDAVPIWRAVHVDRSRYSGADVRRLAAERGCGRPPAVLAARRKGRAQS